jgi:hypothetical protein
MPTFNIAVVRFELRNYYKPPPQKRTLAQPSSAELKPPEAARNAISYLLKVAGNSLSATTLGNQEDAWFKKTP